MAGGAVKPCNGTMHTCDGTMITVHSRDEDRKNNGFHILQPPRGRVMLHIFLPVTGSVGWVTPPPINNVRWVLFVAISEGGCNVALFVKN
jgi:hypothetical protein